MRRILYVTADGILQPLGYSQVVRVVRGLASRGLPYAILSAETPRDLADGARVGAMRDELAAHGIEWITTRWESGSARAAASNLARLARGVAAARGVDLVHARCYHAAVAAWSTRAVTRAPFVFDARSYWIDERIEEGRWFTNPRAARVAKALERRMYRSARAIVTLTRIQAGDLERGSMGRLRARVVETIPTLCDYDAFERASDTPGPWSDVAERGSPVIAIIGSINASYRTDAMIALAARILETSPTAHLLVLSAQGDEFRKLLAGASVPASRYTVTKAAHADMPRWMRHIDWSISLLQSTFAKRASVPTKLAEFFAAGVRPIHHGCNDEVSAWVRRAGSGHVLPDLEPASLQACAELVVGHRGAAGELDRARAITRAHFDLPSGLDRYEQVVARALA